MWLAGCVCLPSPSGDQLGCTAERLQTHGIPNFYFVEPTAVQPRRYDVGAVRQPASVKKNTLVEPILSRLRAEGRVVSGGTEYSTLAKRQFLFQCTSAAIARGGTVITTTLHQSWQ